MRVTRDPPSPSPLSTPKDVVSAQSQAAAKQATAPAKDLSHDWIVAANIAVDYKTAKHANFRLSFKAKDGQRIDALEVYVRGVPPPPGRRRRQAVRGEDRQHPPHRWGPVGACEAQEVRDAR